MEDRAKFDMQLEQPIPGRPQAIAPPAPDTLRAENDALRSMGSWAAAVQGGG